MAHSTARTAVPYQPGNTEPLVLNSNPAALGNLTTSFTWQDRYLTYCTQTYLEKADNERQLQEVVTDKLLEASHCDDDSFHVPAHTQQSHTKATLLREKAIAESQQRNVLNFTKNIFSDDKL